MKRTITTLTALALLAGCSSDDEPATTPAEPVAETADEPDSIESAPPLTEEQVETPLSELMTADEFIDLVFHVEMGDLFWNQSTDAERRDACTGTPEEFQEGAELLADMWVEAAAENDVEITHDFMVEMTLDWFTEQCEFVD